MAYQFSDHIEPGLFDAFVSSHPNGNLLQSAGWAQIKNNWDHLYTGVFQDNQLVAAGLVLIKRLPLGMTLFYLPRGPVLDYHDQALLSFYLRELRKLGKKKRALFIKMDPPILYHHFKEQAQENLNEDLIENFQQAGARHQGFPLEIKESIQPRFHSIIEKSENYFDTLPKKTKKAIQSATKQDIFIQAGRLELLDEFSALVEKTEKRKGVNLRDKAYFKRLLETYPDSSIIMLAFLDPKKSLESKQAMLEEIEVQLEGLPANQKKKRFSLQEKKEGILKDIERLTSLFPDAFPEKPVAIAGVLTIGYGKQAEMLYAGMDEMFRRYMPQYKQYVENIAWAFDQGYETFSMGGIEGDLKDGLSQFKSHFNPWIHEYVGEFDLPTYKILYKPGKWVYQKYRNR